MIDRLNSMPTRHRIRLAITLILAALVLAVVVFALRSGG